MLDHTSDKEHAELATLLDCTAPDKSTLVALLTYLQGSARVAVKLMGNAGNQNESSVLSMLVRGRSTADSASLLGTTISCRSWRVPIPRIFP